MIRFAIEHRWLMVIGVALGIGAGYVSIRNIPIDVYPDFTYPTVTVLTEAHGMAPEEVEALVTIPLETAFNGAPFVYRVSSQSTIGLSFIRVEFQWGTDLRMARQIVAEKIQSIAPILPGEVDAPFMGPIVSQLGEIVEFRLRTADEAISPTELRTLADWIVRYRLQAIPGIAQVIDLGGFVKQYQVLVRPEQLARYDLTLTDVRDAIALGNRNVPGGFLADRSQEYLVRGLGRIRSLRDLRNAVLTVRDDGFPIRAKDVADVRLGPRVRRGAASFNGAETESVVGKVIKQPNVNTFELTRRILDAFRELGASLPEGVSIVPTYLQADLIRRAVDNVKAAVLEGSLLVAVILAAFLFKLRTTAVSLVAIPTSLIATVFVLKWTGHTLNIMTLGGLAIAVGMVVDDGIIDVENTNRRLLEYFRSPTSETSAQVNLRATLEIRNSIVFATVVIALVFLPLLRLEGFEGRMFGPLGKTVLFAMACSLLVSLMVTPALCQILLTRGDRSREKEGRAVLWLRARYRPLLDRVLRHPRTVIGGAALTVFAALCALPWTGREFLPAMDEGTFTLSANTLPGTSLDETRRMAHRIERALLEIPEVISVGTRTGRAEHDEHAHGVFANEILVHVRPPEERERSREELLEEMRRVLSRFPGMVIGVSQPIAHRLDHMLSGVRAQIAIKLFGPDLETLRRKGEEIRGTAATVRGVADLQTEPQVMIPHIAVRIRRDKAARLGLKAGEIADFVRTALNGEVIGQVVEGQRRFDLLVRIVEEDRNDIHAIRDLRIATPTQGRVPLRAVAEVQYERGPNTIHRENVSRRLAIQCNVAGRDLGRVVEEIRRKVTEEVELPEGYFATYGGQFESQRRAMGRLSVQLLLIVVGIFLVLFGVFGSARVAGTMMLNLPLALVGGVVGVFLSGGTVSVSSMVGFILLFGIAVRNGIILISHINDLVREGVPFRRAILRGAEERIAPVLMTALSTSLGMIPLALRGGSGAEIQRPLALVIIGGMLTSTALTLIVLPVVYYRVGPTALHDATDASGPPSGRPPVRL